MTIDEILTPLDARYLSRVHTPGLEARLAGYRAAQAVARAIASKQGVSGPTEIYADGIAAACRDAIGQIEFALTERGVVMEGAQLRKAMHAKRR